MKLSPPHTVLAIAGLSLSVVAAGACSSPQRESTQPGTTPPVLSSTPSGSSATSGSPAAGPGSLQTQLKTPDGKPVAKATITFSGGPDGGYATVTVETVAGGILTPGFHGLHIHGIGKCEPNSVAPTGGPPGNFLSAGGHFQAPGHTGMPESGDLSTLEVRKDGSGYLVTTSDSFTRDQLVGGAGTALMLHGAEHSEMAMDRVACGVIGTG